MSKTRISEIEIAVSSEVGNEYTALSDVRILTTKDLTILFEGAPCSWTVRGRVARGETEPSFFESAHTLDDDECTVAQPGMYLVEIEQ